MVQEKVPIVVFGVVFFIVAMVLAFSLPDIFRPTQPVQSPSLELGILEIEAYSEAFNSPQQPITPEERRLFDLLAMPLDPIEATLSTNAPTSSLSQSVTTSGIQNLHLGTCSGY